MKPIAESIKLSKPALRALAGAKINTLQELAQYSESEIASLHGIGDNALKKLKSALSEAGFSFKQ